jgi:AcrR family transcriptional regulator
MARLTATTTATAAARPHAPARPAGREAVVAAILASARTLIAERGPSAVSLRVIADHARVNQGLVYQYVGTKEQLVAEVYRRAAAETADRLADTADLDAAIDRLLRGVDPADLRLMAWAALEVDDPATLFAPSPALTTLADLIRTAAADDGRPVTATASRHAAALVAMVATAAHVFGPIARRAAGLDPSATRTFDRHVATLLHALGRPGA